MPELAAQYGLGETDFQRALAILDQVKQSLRLPWWQRMSYRLYGIFMCAIIASLAAYVLIFILPGAYAFLVFLLGIAILIFGFGGALISIPLNLPLLVKIHRQKARLRLLGMTDAWFGFVRPRSGRKRWGAIARRIAFALGIILIASGIVGSSVEQDINDLPLPAGVGLIFVMFYFLQEGKVWLDIVASRSNEITQLREKLASLGQQESGPVAVPTELIEKFAQIQTDQILIGRANAIAEFKPSRELFSILSSRKVLEQKARLEAQTRLKVEDAIEELMQNPKPSNSKATTIADSLTYPVNGTHLEIVYASDDKQRQLKLTELRQVSERAQHA